MAPSRVTRTAPENSPEAAKGWMTAANLAVCAGSATAGETRSGHTASDRPRSALRTGLMRRGVEDRGDGLGHRVDRCHAVDGFHLASAAIEVEQRRGVL